MSNSLINETSPYLLQHAENPVHWHPWTAAALEIARIEDKPILLSIGYAACHWCHVMEHESFEDQATADIINRHFICIKVDREERPDIDKIYQTAYQMLNQKPGGWPLNMFLSPESHHPFFGGTYFPADARYGMPPFKVVLERIAEHFKNHRADLQQQNERMQQAFDDMANEKSSNRHVSITNAPLGQACRALMDSFDSVHGGFGGAPKFPHPTNLERCLRHAYLTNDKGITDELLQMCRYTLSKMSEGGFHDHVGGGFFRYSTDEFWMIPHFEKMLYDNAQLIPLYIEAAKTCDAPEFLDVADKTCAWVCRDMQSPEGGYYSSLDADSEGEEGRFYVWDTDEIIKLVSRMQWSLMQFRFGLEGKPNFEGSWHLHANKTMTDTAQKLDLDPLTAQREINQAFARLLDTRSKRVWPGIDDKVLTSWNGMMIGAMSQAGDALGKTEYIRSAEKSLAFIRSHLWDGQRLRVTARQGKSQLNGYLDDYVLLASGIFELLKVRWSAEDMRFLIQLLETVLQHFTDKDNGGFFFTSDDHEKLMTRLKPDADDAIPSGNGIAASLFLKIGHLTGEQRYLDAAEKTLMALWNNINRYPVAHGSLLSALETFLQPPEIIILRGDENFLEEWRKLAAQNTHPDRITLAIPSREKQLPELLSAKSPPDDGVLAYPCRGSTCLPVISNINEFHQYLVDPAV